MTTSEVTLRTPTTINIEGLSTTKIFWLHAVKFVSTCESNSTKLPWTGWVSYRLFGPNLHNILTLFGITLQLIQFDVSFQMIHFFAGLLCFGFKNIQANLVFYLLEPKLCYAMLADFAQFQCFHCHICEGRNQKITATTVLKETRLWPIQFDAFIFAARWASAVFCQMILKRQYWLGY